MVKKNKVNLRNPWKKLVLVGVIIVILAIGVNLLDNYVSLLPSTSPLYSMLPYIYIGIAAVIFIIILIFVILRSERANEPESNIKEITDKDVGRILLKMDSLLEKLPQKEIDKFSRGKDAELYKAVIKKYRRK